MLSSELLLAFYGDDFSGSTDVLESLELAGVRGVLFLEPPEPLQLARFPDARAVGVAGMTRALSPAAMTPVLADAFRRLGRLSPRVVQYKVCSTFDSSPEIGSIGRALEVGMRAFAGPFVPLVVGAPRLGRFCVFGQLFVHGQCEVTRLDRHPAMREHPVTPMEEADLRRHLAQQTATRSLLFDVRALAGAPAEVEARFSRRLRGEAEVVLFDVLSEDDLVAIGRLLWARTGKGALFGVGSAGLTDALTAAWREYGLCSPPPVRGFGPTEGLLVVSGSASPQTAEQIACAVAAGFTEVVLDPGAIGPAEEERCRAKALEGFADGRSVVIHSARGPQDSRLRRGACAAETVGASLARIARGVIENVPLERLVVAGGDTSGRVARALEFEALTFVASTAPGSPLCQVHAPNGLNGLQVAFKGGQVGDPQYFIRVKDGRFP